MQSRFSFLIPTRDRERQPRKMSRVDRLRMRTKGKCGYCGVYVPKGETTRDHIIPKAKGGPTTSDNLLICCRECNQRKGHLDLEEFRDLYFAGDMFWVEILEGGAA